MDIGKATDMVREIRKDAYQEGYRKGVQDTFDAIDTVLAEKRNAAHIERLNQAVVECARH